MLKQILCREHRIRLPIKISRIKRTFGNLSRFHSMDHLHRSHGLEREFVWRYSYHISVLIVQISHPLVGNSIYNMLGGYEACDFAYNWTGIGVQEVEEQ